MEDKEIYARLSKLEKKLQECREEILSIKQSISKLDEQEIRSKQREKYHDLIYGRIESWKFASTVLKDQTCQERCAVPFVQEKEDAKFAPKT